MSFESSPGRGEKKRKWNFLPECLSKLILSLFFCSPVPNVSFHVYAESFLAQFFESHAVMLQGNAGLKPKEGELTSQPWMWPINYKVSSARLSHNSPVLCFFLRCSSSSELFMPKLKLKFLFAFARCVFFYFRMNWKKNHRVQGQFFSGGNFRIYLLGNPFLWWSNLAFLGIFIITYLVALVSHQRSISREVVSKANSTDIESTSEY